MVGFFKVVKDFELNEEITVQQLRPLSACGPSQMHSHNDGNLNNEVIVGGIVETTYGDDGSVGHDMVNHGDVDDHINYDNEVLNGDKISNANSVNNCNKDENDSNIDSNTGSSDSYAEYLVPDKEIDSCKYHMN